MAIKFETVEFTLPEYWASAIINGDTSGMEPEEIAQIDAFYADNSEYECFNIENEQEPEFYRNHDASAYGVLAASCLTFTGLKRVK